MSSAVRSPQSISRCPVKRLDPLIRRLSLKLIPPSLEDNRSPEARLRAAVAQLLGEVPELPLPILQSLPLVLNRDWCPVVDCLFDGRWHVVAIHGESPPPPLGLAIDLGSTTVVFYLVDLSSGEVIHQRSALNPQVEYGEDILTRLHLASKKEGLERIHHLTIEFLNREILSLAEGVGYRPQDISILVLAGNTTMTHFFLNLDPSMIFREPYVPLANRFDFFLAKDLALELSPLAKVYVFPNAGSYFGGDLIAGILASGMHRRPGLNFLVDVGTNAEVVLGNQDFLVACAGAAGPALEGGILTCGMRARKGAIERVRIDPESLQVNYKVIGDVPPEGLCGSGIIDLLAQMFLAGLVDQRGRLMIEKDPSRMVEIDGQRAYVVAFPEETSHGQPIYITEADIKNLIRSKGAMYTILTVVCRSVGVSFEDIENFYVAGAFGNYIDPEAAVIIGMLPDIPLSRFQPLGNAAGQGAICLLLNRQALGEIDEILKKLTYLEMNVRGEFMQLLTGALFIPHTDPNLFPSVKAKLGSRG